MLGEESRDVTLRRSRLGRSRLERYIPKESDPLWGLALRAFGGSPCRAAWSGPVRDASAEGRQCHGLWTRRLRIRVRGGRDAMTDRYAQLSGARGARTGGGPNEWRPYIYGSTLHSPGFCPLDAAPPRT